MHYGDKEQLEGNTLKLVVYTHGDPGKFHGGGTIYDVTSIQECKYFRVSLLEKILKTKKNWSGWFTNHSQFKDLKQERYYLVEFKQTGFNDFEVVGITDVSDSKNELLHIH